MIEEFSPMWTNKESWEYEQTNEDLFFDLACTKPGEGVSKNSKLARPASDLRDAAAELYEYMQDGYELWVAENGGGGIKKDHVPYAMSVLVDVMSDEEAPLNFRMEAGFLVAAIDAKADVIDCKEFFEAFYHLATGFNYTDDAGIPDDETEAEIHLSRLQDEFDERMSAKLGSRYLPKNSDPDSEE